MEVSPDCSKWGFADHNRLSQDGTFGSLTPGD